MRVEPFTEEALEDVDPANVFGREFRLSLSVQLSQALETLFRWLLHIGSAPSGDHELPERFEFVIDLRAIHV